MTRTITGPAGAKQARRRRWCRAGSPLLLAVSALAAPLPATALEAGAVTSWASAGHAAARLLAAGPGADPARRLAALEIRLDPGFITYWRNPGEAGLPPTLDTAASINVASVALDFPPPRRLDEGGVTAFGYVDDVMLPLRVDLKDAALPASLVVDLDYAVCSTICLPAHAHLALPLPAGATPEVAAMLDRAVAAVPRVRALGQPGPLGIDAVAATPGGGVLVTARAGAGATLFAEAPDGWYVEPGPVMPDGAGRVRVAVAVPQRPEGVTLAGLPLRLTLVDETGAIDTTVRMDAAAAKP